MKVFLRPGVLWTIHLIGLLIVGLPAPADAQKVETKIKPAKAAKFATVRVDPAPRPSDWRPTLARTGPDADARKAEAWSKLEKAVQASLASSPAFEEGPDLTIQMSIGYQLPIEVPGLLSIRLLSVNSSVAFVNASGTVVAEIGVNQTDAGVTEAGSDRALDIAIQKIAAKIADYAKKNLKQR